MSSNPNHIDYFEFGLKLIPIACVIVSIPTRNFWCQNFFEATGIGCTHSYLSDARLFLAVPHQKFQHQELSWYLALWARKLRCDEIWWLSEVSRLWGTRKLENLGGFEGKREEIHGGGRIYMGQGGGSCEGSINGIFRVTEIVWRYIHWIRYFTGGGSLWKESIVLYWLLFE